MIKIGLEILSLLKILLRTLIGRHISHKFKVEKSEYKWYEGTVINCDPLNKTYHIEYEEDNEPSYFDLNIDLLNGDLEVLD